MHPSLELLDLGVLDRRLLEQDRKNFDVHTVLLEFEDLGENEGLGDLRKARHDVCNTSALTHCGNPGELDVLCGIQSDHRSPILTGSHLVIFRRAKKSITPSSVP